MTYTTCNDLAGSGTGPLQSAAAWPKVSVIAGEHGLPSEAAGLQDVTFSFKTVMALSFLISLSLSLSRPASVCLTQNHDHFPDAAECSGELEQDF